MSEVNSKNFETLQLHAGYVDGLIHSLTCS